jgi:putative transcriptional regulator
VSSLAPALLLSMPQLTDPNFNRTVVLLCKHSEEGAFGLVVNRPLVTSGRVVTAFDPMISVSHDLQIWLGGPVEPERSWMLVNAEPGDELAMSGMRVAEGIYLSTSPELWRRLLEPDPPRGARLIAGYAGWSAGQLEEELQESSWLLSDVDAELLFSTPADRMWEAAIRRLGADPALLQVSRGVH